MAKKTLIFVLSVILFLLVSCELKVTENGYTVPEKSSDEEEVTLVFDGNESDTSFTASAMDLQLFSPKVYDMPTTDKGYTITKLYFTYYWSNYDGWYYEYVNGGWQYRSGHYPYTLTITDPNDGTKQLTGYGQSPRDAGYYNGNYYSGNYGWWWREFYVDYYFPEYVVIHNHPPANYIEDEGYIAPKVVKIDNRYYMWYTHVYKEYINDRSAYYRKFNYRYEVNCVESTDGMTWSQSNDAYFISFNSLTAGNDGGGIIPSDIVKTNNGNMYLAYYLAKSSASGTDEGWNLYTAYSTDGPRDWVRKSTSLINMIGTTSGAFDSLNVGMSKSIYNGSKYETWYTGEDSRKRKQIGYATSSDGISPATKRSEPIYKGKSGRFDEKSVMDPCVIKDGKIYKMYYIGYNNIQYRPGLAYSYDGITYQYHDTELYQPIDLGEGSNDIRYPFIIEDTDVNGNRILRMYYCQKETIQGIKVNASGTPSYPNTSIWTIRMAVSKPYIE